MKTKKLWILEYTTRTGAGELVPLYCLDEKDAESKVAQWCLDYDVKISNTRSIPFPRGFVIHRSVLPGEITSKE